MADQNPNPSLMNVSFELGEYSFTIAPTSFDVGAYRKSFGDDGVIYCEFKFNSFWFSGKLYDVIEPADFIALKYALTKMMNKLPDTAEVVGLEGFVSVKVEWNEEHQVAAFQVQMPADMIRMDDELIDHHARGSMKNAVEMVWCLKPDELEWPLYELEAILDHINVLQATDAVE